MTDLILIVMVALGTGATLIFLSQIVKRLDVLIALLDDRVEFEADDDADTDDDDGAGHALAA